ncbi:MAG: molybdenum cofactor guanylyltransferase [Methanobacteriota archaeon]|nr:MAG: molybdenum cofactor guanylyltransferase [Euryarchaeota archaeon]
MNTLNPQQITGIILSGGDSTRFGSDKALAPFLGTSFLLRQLGLLEKVCSKVFLSVKNEEKLTEYRRHIIEGWKLEKLPDWLSFVVDSPDFYSRGPAKGVFSCLKKATSEYILVIPVDMPFIEIAHLSFLQKLFKKKQINKEIALVGWKQKNGKIPYPFFMGKTIPILELLKRVKKSSTVPLRWIYHQVPNQILIEPINDQFLTNINFPELLNKPKSQIPFHVKSLFIRHHNP